MIKLGVEEFLHLIKEGLIFVQIKVSKKINRILNNFFSYFPPSFLRVCSQKRPFFKNTPLVHSNKTRTRLEQNTPKVPFLCHHVSGWVILYHCVSGCVIVCQGVSPCVNSYQGASIRVRVCQVLVCQ